MITKIIAILCFLAGIIHAMRTMEHARKYGRPIQEKDNSFIGYFICDK